MGNPFVGPTYPLASRPASVQRTINMMPVPLEPGNERTAWTLKDVPGYTAVALTNNIVAAFTYSATGLLLTFTDTSAIGPVTWSWNFGDSNTSTSQSPTHTYAATGTYTVSLTVTNAAGKSSTTTQSVTTGHAWVSVPLTGFTAQTWEAITYSPLLGMYAAIGNGSQVATSTDGKTWTKRTVTSRAYEDLLWIPGANIFCAVQASTGDSTISSDGITWTDHAMGATATLWGSLLGDGLSIFLSQYSPTSQNMLTSPDGITWTTHATAFPSAQAWGALARSPTLARMAAVANPGSSAVAAYSSDGLTWNSTTLPNARFWRKLIWSGTQFFLICFDSGTTIYATSPDGVIWTEHTTLPTSQQWCGAAYDPTKGTMAVGFGTASAASTDGLTWTPYTMPSNQNWYEVASAPGQFVAIPQNSLASFALWS